MNSLYDLQDTIQLQYCYPFSISSSVAGRDPIGSSSESALPYCRSRADSVSNSFFSSFM
ncbi:unnamed protein product [Chondrus crispus]|uniref:Uncharacterized protein n=1 Tax=Chondrus crispus TaxID=2769 RepID=R7Q3I8_CHOCR|nr:unnamed protein product [Chondrus crispus]CDF33102.1 unnamed protein product [Chondrus crispus]|eukprot:XP_005712905.1 unnamed protein product [Chondrus crispus]